MVVFLVERNVKVDKEVAKIPHNAETEGVYREGLGRANVL